MLHIPVLYQDTLDMLDIQPSDVVVDGTIGYGGHSQGILKKLGPEGRLIGCDQDPASLAACKTIFSQDARVTLVHKNFSTLATLLREMGLVGVDKLLVDLGMSSVQLDDASRGFSYLKEGPLDMRMNSEQGTTAGHILNTYPSHQLVEMWKVYGDIRQPEKLAQHILDNRTVSPYTHTGQLIYAIKKSFFFRNSRSVYLKTCAQVFQALRIEVNQEIASLKTLLEDIPHLIKPNGRVAIISFHSVEDRLVKQQFASLKNMTPLSKKPITITQKEFKNNPRSKPAKLRGYIIT